jgi:hypothetical protein
MDYLKRIERELDLPPAEKEQALAELRAHFQDIRDDLIAKDASVEDADKEAAKRLGTPESIAAGLGAVHLREGWRSVVLSLAAFLAIVPAGMMSWGMHAVSVPDGAATIAIAIDRPLVLSGMALLVAFGLTMFVVAIREVLRDRRPAWLAPCMAIAIMWPAAFVANAQAPAALVTNYVQTDSYPVNFIEDGRGLFFRWVLMFSGFFVACAWARAGKWRLLAMGVAAGSALGYAAYQNGAWSCLPMMVLFICAPGVVVFARHPYGSPNRASLFLFACYTFPMLLQHQVAVVVALISVVAAVVACCRAADRATKYAVLLLGGAAAGTVTLALHYDYTLQSLLAAGLLLVMMPMAFETRRRRDQDPLIAD